jgi:DNA adenine methylase
MIGPLPWIGGKRRIAKRLAALLPEHQTYIEPFCGGAQLFFAKPRSRVEVLNDLDGELVNFLKVCQLHHPELVRYLAFSTSSRKWFENYAALDPATLTDVQRAARFYYLQKHSFGGRIHGQNYHYSVSKPTNYKTDLIADTLSAVAQRLNRVQLESWPYEKVIERYDRPDTVFYIDPPYVGVPYYRHNLADDEFPRLAERLANIKGKFLLSINDCELARNAFANFHRRELSLVYTTSRTVPTATELIFSNYEIPARP